MNAEEFATPVQVRIAIIIAVYNGAATLERTLDSLASQTRPPDEVVVMDGGSTDGTQAILARRSDVVSHWQSGRDAGIFDAWNKALGHVTAEWVAFLGSDDRLWDDTVLQRLAAAAAAAPAAPYIYGRVHEIDATGQVLAVVGRPWELCCERFAIEMTLPHVGMLHRRAVCFAQGGFDTGYRIAGDYALLRPVLLRHDPVFVDMVVAAAQEGGVSTHPDRRVQSVREAGRAILAGDGVRPLGWHLMLAKNHVRRWVWRLFGEGGLQKARALVGADRSSR